MDGSLEPGTGPSGLLRRWLKTDPGNGAVDGVAQAGGGEPSLADGAPVGLFLLDADGHILDLNTTLADWLGYTSQELTSGTIALADFLVVDGEGGVAFQPLAANQNALEVDFTLVAGRNTAQRRVRVLQHRAVDDPTRIHGSVVALIDRADPADGYRRLEERFRRFFDCAPVGIAWVDLDGEIGECNIAFRELVHADAAPGAPFALGSIVAGKDQATAMVQLARLRDKELQRVSVEVHLSSAAEAVVDLHLNRIDDDTGKPLGAVVHAVDATERKNLEMQFSQSQKMQAVGQLAGGIAHDFNNLLTAMIGFCDLLLLRYRPGEESFADIMQVKQNANRAANLVRQLLAFSRQQTLAPKVLNITDVIAELSYLLRRLIGENIVLEINHGRDVGPVRVDHGQLEQVIINLAVNARDAMSDGGTLTIRTSGIVVDDPLRRGAEVMPPGDYALIEITDTGSGIAEENLERIFEPFFSTKEVGAGTGLGLSTVYGIVRQTGGFVFVDNMPDGGARFSVFLPFHEALQDAPRALKIETDDAVARDLTGHGTVLLVEDEDAVRLFGARALRNKGYTVLEASGGHNALSVLRDAGRDVDVLVTDIVMPEMDGPSLIQAVREQRPDIKVICISGYAEDAVRRRLDATEDIHFLPKPFNLAQLAAMVKEVIRDDDSPRSVAL
ncbi:MAG: response regulator [Alphaproteobacteria bacterium]|nr:response regulator [Alphaproteobacteria bacterium]